MGKGRFANKPCQCGSGQKFKRCCMNKKNAASSFQQKKANNHYVPSSYQRRFISSGKKLHYLVLDPYKNLPDGRKKKCNELYEEGPKNTKFFCEKDLYTTNFFGNRNEDIETFLFGKIDGNVPDALDGLAENDPYRLHKYFQYIFEYIDAQKLRTPKGLDWIRSNYFQLTKNELLLEMQSLRTMHCTMWVEGVMEIVSAENSDVKFIVSDHPVTIYNYACSPDSEVCEYPNDPSIAWKASQTIFPLDLNHCLILTNLEYASSPDTVDPTSGRTNPRFFSQTITRWDKIIRERKLKSNEVCAINYVIKKRARNHIAAGKKEWLYPENIYNPDNWDDLRKILLPPENQVHGFGGEIYVGGGDGLIWYQDAYGRRYTSRENEKDPIRQLSIGKRNEILMNAIWKIFGFDEGKSWNDFRRELTDEKIKELYRVFGSLWNPDTEITKLLPKPDDQKLRAFYHGMLDPRITPLTIVGYSLYVDQVVICSPFFNPRTMNPKYSPYENPNQYRDDTIKNIRMILDLMPLIDSGIVEMIPDPCDLNSDLRLRTFKMAETRMKYRSVDEKDMDFYHKLMKQDSERLFFNLPQEILIEKIKKTSPDMTEGEVTSILEYIERKKLTDPLAPLQPIDINDPDGQLHIYRGSTTHEMAVYLAQITGSFLYTETKHSLNEYKLAELKKTNEETSNPWEPLEKAFNEYMLIMYVYPDPRFWPQIKERGYLREFIDFYKRVLESVRTIDNYEDARAKALEHVESLKKINLKKIFQKIEKDYRKEFKNEGTEIMSRKVLIPASYFFPMNGISSNYITQILLTHGINTSYWKSVPFGVYLNLNEIRALVEKRSLISVLHDVALKMHDQLLKLQVKYLGRKKF